MKKTMLSTLAAVVVLAVSGCLPAKQNTTEALPLPLSGPEINQKLAGNSVYRKATKGLARWEYASHHSEDGSLSARSWWLGGADLAQGRWEITSDGLYCRVWHNHWAQGEMGCFRAFASKSSGDLILDHVSGNPGDSKRYSYKILVGNPYNL